MASVPDMGRDQDMFQRQALVRIADNDLRNKVLDARRLIYEKNYAVNSPVVERLLKDASLIPTLVGENVMGCYVLVLTHAECIYRETSDVWVQCIRYARSRPATRV